jgi:small-conductance mechanosensitive channel
MSEKILQTIINSLQDLLASAIKILPALLTTLIIIMLTKYVADFTKGIAEKTGKKFLSNQSLQFLLIKTTYMTAWVVGILIASVIAFPGLNLGDIIATLGLSSVAIGFAFQDIFKNFLAGILILIHQPFNIDDQIIVEDYEGTVEGIDIRTTKIRTYQGELVLIPNSTIFTSAVQVRTAYNSRRTDLMVGLDYNTSLTKAVSLIENTITKVEGVLDNPYPEIDVVNFGGSSIDLIVRYWTLSQQQKVRQAQTKAIIAIKQICDQENINIPYPISTVYFYDQEKYNDYIIHDDHQKKDPNKV